MLLLLLNKFLGVVDVMSCFGLPFDEEFSAVGCLVAEHELLFILLPLERSRL